MMKYIYRFNQPRLLQVNDITLNELLRTLRIYNKENEITIFSLNSRKEFMVDKKLETKIKEIWFDADFLYGRDDEGWEYRQSLLCYPRLRAASDEERNLYTFGFDGIHWRGIDEDVSFESFEYEDAEL